MNVGRIYCEVKSQRALKSKVPSGSGETLGDSGSRPGLGVESRGETGFANSQTEVGSSLLQTGKRLTLGFRREGTSTLIHAHGPWSRRDLGEELCGALVGRARHQGSQHSTRRGHKAAGARTQDPSS